MVGKRKVTGCLLALLLFNTVKQMGTTRFIILFYIFYFVKRIKLFKVVLRRVVFVSEEPCLIITVIVTTSIDVG